MCSQILAQHSQGAGSSLPGQTWTEGKNGEGFASGESKVTTEQHL